MSITNIKITEANEKSIANYLALNHPGYRILKEDEYQFAVNGQRFRPEIKMSTNKLATVSLGTEEGIELTFPIELFRKPSTAVIPVLLTEDGDMNIEFVIDNSRKEKATLLGNADTVHSFQNFEIRNGRFQARTNNKLMGEHNLLIIKA